MSSRVVVKDLPKFAIESEIRTMFSKIAPITDLYMVKNHMGVFRRICFIGYKTEEEAEKVIEYHNKTYFKNFKLRVEKEESSKPENTKKSTKEKGAEKKDTNVESPPSTNSLSPLERQCLYNKSLFITNLQDIPLNIIQQECASFGSILEIKEQDKGIFLKFHRGEDALKFLHTKKVIAGNRIRITNYKESTENSKPQSHFNTLFFDFSMVGKNISELEGIEKDSFIKLEDKSLGVKMSILESMLIDKTREWLRTKGIEVDKSTGVNKQRLIVRCSDILGAVEHIKLDHSVSISPSRCLALVDFPREKDAEIIQKKINLKRHKEGVIYAEYAPQSTVAPEGTVKEELDTKEKTQDPKEKTQDTKEKTQDTKEKPELVAKRKLSDKPSKVIKRSPTCFKLCVKNLPFQATKEEVAELFSTVGKIQEVRIPKKECSDKDATRINVHRGFCFVTFKNEKDVKRAIEIYDGVHLYGRRLILQQAQK